MLPVRRSPLHRVDSFCGLSGALILCGACAQIKWRAILRAAIGKRELWRSFGDVSHAEALKLARLESVRADELFASTRDATRRTPLADLSDADLQHIARAYLHELETAAPPMPFDERERQERREEAEEGAALVGQSINDPTLQGIAKGVAREARLSVQAGTVAFLRLTEAVQRALIEHGGREADRAALLPERVDDPLFAGVTKDAPAPAKPLTLGRAIELYVGDVERQHLSPKTLLAYKFKFNAIEELLGRDKAVSLISRVDVRDARDVLLRLPSNATKRFPGIPLRKVSETAEAKGIEPMSPKSVTMYVECLSSLFRWLVREELADRNPAEGLKGPALPDETDRRPFTIDELDRLFAAPTFSGRTGTGWAYWVPRVALFSGARFAEILGLRASDVVEHEGVPMLQIEPNDVRGLKTKTSRRLVPVHPALVELGLLRHGEALSKDGLLFPDALGPKDFITARNQQMGRGIRSIIADENVVFHSFRHAFKDAAERADIPREHIAAIGGWDVPGGKVAMDGYGRAKHAAKLAAEIAKVRYEGLTLRPPNSASTGGTGRRVKKMRL